jgi:hypothetical protein
MVAIATKSTGGTVTAAEFNQLPDELEQVVTDSGQSPAAGTLDQVSKAVTQLVANADFYTDGGAADAYVLSVVSPNKAPTSYRNGMRVRFRTTNANTGASTVNVGGLGVKNIKKQNGSSDPDAADISNARENIMAYDGTSFRLITELNEASTTLKGIVELTTNAEALAGVDTTRALTVAALKSLFAGTSRGGNGYMRLPVGVGAAFDEMIVQWGEESVVAAATDTVNLPLTFPTAHLACYATCNLAAAEVGGGVTAHANNLSTSQIKVTNDNITTTPTVDIFFLAIGY